MAVRSAPIVGPTNLVSGATVTYTAPAGTVVLVKYITMRMAAALDRVTFLGSIGAGTFRQLIERTSSAATQSFELEAFYVLAAGDRIQFQNNGTSAVNVSASGAVLVV